MNYYYNLSTLLSLYILNIYVYIHIYTQRNVATINSVEFKLLKGKGQAGRGFEQPAVVEGVPVHGRVLQTSWSSRFLPNKIILIFYEQVK